MHPRLFEIPFVHLTIWSFGAMMAVGFLAGLWVLRRFSRRAGLDPEMISNAALYSLAIGVVGARIFFIIHHHEEVGGGFINAIAIWRGGLEFLGGMIPAVVFLWFYLWRHKQSVRRYMDILAMGLMVGLAFGRIGCFLNGCCYGRPTELACGIRFPYGSYAYMSQISFDPERGRAEPYLNLPGEYFYFTDDGRRYLLPFEDLDEQQRYEVTKGRYRCLAVHPTQLYSSGNALLLFGIMYLVWQHSLAGKRAGRLGKLIGRPGMTVAAMLILYSVGRFILEVIRDDNPYEVFALTISQIMGIVMFAGGIVLFAVLVSSKSKAT